MTPAQNAARIGPLMVLVAVLLGWLAAHTEILYADGLRYIHQAQVIDSGAWREGLLGAVDHPVYPLAIAATHRWIGGEGPLAWQRAAQMASVLAGILLVVPLYLVALELYGASSAWLACVLTFAVPLTGHVMADALSESTFLLFWTWGLWAGLRFLKAGRFAWLPLAIGFGALSYLSRPEGLLLPAALVTALLLMPLMHSTRLNWPRWWAAIAFLVIGAVGIVGPYIAIKGGLGTKPAIARLLGTAKSAPADAVERQRPLDPDQSIAKTYGVAAKAMFEAVRDAVSIPLLALWLVGIVAAWPPGERARMWLLLWIIAVATMLALVRLHATGGYCSPRHALVLALLVIPASANGLRWLLGSLRIPGEWLGLGEGRFTAGPAVWAVVLLALIAFQRRDLVRPINEGLGGYRQAGDWLAANAPGDARVADLSGWALFYSQHPGYTFANFHETAGDPQLRWVVAREAHLKGPWGYCEQLRQLVGDRAPVATFPANPTPGQTRVYVFDRMAPQAQAALAPGDGRKK